MTYQQKKSQPPFKKFALVQEREKVDDLSAKKGQPPFKMFALVQEREKVDDLVCHLRLTIHYSRYHPKTQAKMSGATIVASLSTMYFGVWMSSLPQVIFSLGTAPE